MFVTIYCITTFYHPLATVIDLRKAHAMRLHDNTTLHQDKKLPPRGAAPPRALLRVTESAPLSSVVVGMC
ncbi:hypothetical protein Y032_0081g1421 [Ancylostoma ceylanicum]|uniref:Uncharacterized protein n=1 Tax=Ancylostoma ceylanicum TaxID=53326 RepID=A0A016TS15_9BILA|nr:hypothetical protein Y032_0081g1421 [Ancylostoma ceylanicum]